MALGVLEINVNELGFDIKCEKLANVSKLTPSEVAKATYRETD
jgi:hypothetical protein